MLKYKLGNCSEKGRGEGWVAGKEDPGREMSLGRILPVVEGRKQDSELMPVSDGLQIQKMRLTGNTRFIISCNFCIFVLYTAWC